MDLLAKQKVYVWTIISLILLNLAILLIMWIGTVRPPIMPFGKGRGMPSAMDILTKEFDLSSEQQVQFKKYVDEHLKNLKSVSSQISVLRKNLMSGVFAKNPDFTSYTSITDSIGILYSKMEKLSFDHFVTLKSILNEEQQEKLKIFLDKTLRFRDRMPSPSGQNDPRHPADEGGPPPPQP